MQDPWNSTPAWGYPFSESKLAPSPAASALLDGGLAQQVAGVGAYAFLANSYYFELGGYHTLGAKLQKSLGSFDSAETQVTGLAPYWRLAVDRMVGDGRWEVGTFGLAANTYPGRDPSQGQDRYVDLGLDTQYQLSSGPHDVTALLSWIYERENWNASQALTLVDNTRDSLRDLKATVSYLYDKTYGATVQYFQISGSTDATLYGNSANGSPNTDGVVLQASYLPFNKGGGPAFWPKSNVKFALQYTIYNRFNGARTNYDGAGANARDNNTLYFEMWIAF